jgi:hypothetical protein
MGGRALGAVIVTAAAALLLVALGVADGKLGGRHGTVRVATSGSYSERIKKLPITRKRGASRRVVMAMTPRQLPRLRRGDRLRLSSEVQFTLNCPERMKRCIGPPYRYDPEIDVRLVIAGSATSRHGLAVSATKRETCQQHRPREHHCVVTIAAGGLRVGDPRRLPCRPGRCFVNLVADAHSPHAGGRDVLIVGGNKPDGSIPQDRGRINAILFHPAKARYPRPRLTRDRVESELPLDLKRQVVYSQRLRGLRRGEQLAAEAKVVTRRAGLPYSVRTSSQLILAAGRHDVRPGPLARRVGGGGELDEANGFNCTRDRETCTTRKFGVLRIGRSAELHGHPRPLYVNVVMVVGPKRFEADPADRYEVLRRGGLRVTRYRGP